jgi:hypothetical protein
MSSQDLLYFIGEYFIPQMGYINGSGSNVEHMTGKGC